MRSENDLRWSRGSMTSRIVNPLPVGVGSGHWTKVEKGGFEKMKKSTIENGEFVPNQLKGRIE